MALVDEKTFEPTPHRRQQARREGHVAKSQDLGSAALLLSAYAQRKIGGWTGDTLGATCEVVEIVPALVMLLRLTEIA